MSMTTIDQSPANNPANPAYDPLEWYGEVPRKVSRIGIFGVFLMVLAFGGFGSWATMAPLASAVIAQGSFVATGQNKIVQHLEGGIIQSILVAEGQEVVAGQVLMILDPTAAQSRLSELELRKVRLQAIDARLQAEYNGLDRVVFPESLIDRISDPRVAAVLENQRVNFEVSRSKLENDIDLISANIAALRQRITGYTIQGASLTRQMDILAEDHVAKATLLERGLIRKPEFNSLERAIAEGEGQMARIDAEIAESKTMIGKYERQVRQTQQAYRQAALDEIQAVQGELDSVSEQAQNARDVLRRTRILAPVSGTILRLHYHTSGGVVESGKGIAEILPQGADLVIETMVPRTEIDSVTLGHQATVRLVAMNQRTTPVLTGVVDYVSADAIPDNSTGVRREVYVARVGLDPRELARIPDFRPIPGMPAEILIKTRDRTFFQYLTKPIRDSMSRAFRED